jgi:hypothetical protein
MEVGILLLRLSSTSQAISFFQKKNGFTTESVHAVLYQTAKMAVIILHSNPDAPSPTLPLLILV